MIDGRDWKIRLGWDQHHFGINPVFSNTTHNIEGLGTGLRIKTGIRVLMLFSFLTDNKFRTEQAISKAAKITKITLLLS